MSSIEQPAGFKLLNPGPIEEKMRVDKLSDLADNPTLYVGYSGIFDKDTGKLYWVSGGDSDAGWRGIFELHPIRKSLLRGQFRDS